MKRALLCLALLLAPSSAAWGQQRSLDREVAAACDRGVALEKQGDLKAAAVQYEWAVQRAERVHGPNDDRTGIVLELLANVCLELGRYEEAEPLYQRILRIIEAGHDKGHPDYAFALNNLASLYKEMGRYGEAEPLYRRSLAIIETARGKEDFSCAPALNNLASLYKEMGRYVEAESFQRRGLRIIEATRGKKHPDYAMYLHNLANLYRETGRYEQAEPLYLESIRVAEAVRGKDHPEVANYLNNLAILYWRQRRYEQAESLYQRCLAIREDRLGKDHPAVALALNNLAVVHKDMGRLEQSESLQRRSLAIEEARLGKDHPSVARTLQNLATVCQETGRLDEAGSLYRRSLAIEETRLGKDHPEVAGALNNLALLESGRGHWAEAAAFMERSRRVVRRHGQRILPALSDREQLDFLRRTDRRGLDNALWMGWDRRGNTGLAAQSAGWLLNGKGVTQEVLAQRALLGREAHDAQTAALVGRLQGVRRQLARLSLAVPRAGQEEDHRRTLDRLAAQEQELSRQIGRAAASPRRDDPWVSLDEVRQALPADAVLVDISTFRGGKFQHWAAWIIPPAGRGDVRVIDLGEADKIEPAVQAVRAALRNSPAALRDRGETDAEKEVARPLEELAKKVLHPLLEHIGASKQWVLSPDDALWLVPWAALPLPNGKYAVEEHTIRYVVSGRDLVTPPARGRPGRSRIVADPDYDLAPAEALAQAVKLVGERNPGELRGALPGAQVPTNWPRLPGTAIEAAAVKPSLARYAGEEPWVYLRENALEGVVKAFKAPRVLVLSTHGYFLPGEEKMSGADRGAENPLLRCGLLLSGCNQRDKATGPRDEDGVLTGLEILEMDLRGTELVVLSACETGLGDVRNGEGVAGLRQAFQLAGTRAVVATLWQIPDRETARLMNDFFAQLAEGQDKAEALRQAQLKLIESRRQRDGAAHPLFWAAFTLTGQGK